LNWILPALRHIFVVALATTMERDLLELSLLMTVGAVLNHSQNLTSTYLDNTSG